MLALLSAIIRQAAYEETTVLLGMEYKRAIRA